MLISHKLSNRLTTGLVNSVKKPVGKYNIPDRAIFYRRKEFLTVCRQ